MTWLLLLGIVVYFVALQLCLRHYEPGLERDSVGILTIVASWQETGQYLSDGKNGFFVPPFALYCYRVPLMLGLPLEPGILFLLLLLGISVLILFYFLVCEFCGNNEIALVCAALMASNPYFHYIYKSIIRDPVFIPLALLSCYLILLYYKQPRVITVWAAALAAGLAFLTRYEGFVLPLIFIAAAVAASLRDRTWKKNTAAILCYLLVWSAAVWLPLYFWGLHTIAWRIYLWRFLNLA